MKTIHLFFCLFILSSSLLLAQTTTKFGTESGSLGNNNSFFGYRAGKTANVASFGNSIFGSESGMTMTSANSSSFFGYGAGRATTTGFSNTFMGYQAGWTNSTGGLNTFLGSLSGYSSTTASGNVFVGYAAGNKNTTGKDNVYVGTNSGYTSTIGYENTFVGVNTGNKNVSSGNSFFGAYAGETNSSGVNNTFLGTSAGRKTTNGDYNLFVGYQSGFSNTDGQGNTTLGFQAGYKNTLGNNNVFVGYQAGYNETGSNKLYINNSQADIPLIYGDFGQKVIGIGTKNYIDNNVKYTLSVNGKMRAKEVKVYTNWADYVFADDFKLKSLEEVEAFIRQNKHLPDVPSAAEVEKDGIFVGEMSKIQMQKIEELTLYVLELHKYNILKDQTIQSLQKQLEDLVVEIKQLKNAINK